MVPHPRRTRHPRTIQQVELNGLDLSIEEVVAVARHRARVSLAPDARVRVRKCRAIVDFLGARGVKVYGLTTGFGSRRDVFIESEQTIQLQTNLIQSHASGVGEPLAEDVVRAIMLLRANTLARGCSGIRDHVLETLLDMLNKDVYPFIPAKGSVGASGDLAPLSHLTLVLMGHEGGLVFEGEREAGGLGARRGQNYVSQPRRKDFQPATTERLKRLGFEPVVLEAKEGLALNNGTQVMGALVALTVYDAEQLIKVAEIACAASIEAHLGVPRAFDPRIHAVRGHSGQTRSAQNLRALMKGSELMGMPLNLTLLATVQRSLADAIQLLMTIQEPSCQALSTNLSEISDKLQAVLADPWGAIRAAMSTHNDQDKTRFATSQLELRGGRESLQVLSAALRRAGHALLAPSIPEAAGPVRDLLLKAQTDLERVVPVHPRVQDDYSLRCSPQVIGAARDTLRHVAEVARVEINAATDNPLIFLPTWLADFDGNLEDAVLRFTEAECVDAVVSGGNFHGEPIGVVADFMKVALAEVGSISERRTNHLVDGHHNQGLPSLLVKHSGLNSGLMIPQYTAAALVSENKVLAHPATVDSIPTCENTEDHVSMGTIAARQAREILENVELVVAIECLTAFQALHFRSPLQPGRGTSAFLSSLAAQGLKFVEEDRVLYPDIEKLTQLIRREEIVDAVEAALGGPLLGIEGEGAA